MGPKDLVRAGHRVRDILQGRKWVAGTGQGFSTCSCTQHPLAGLPPYWGGHSHLQALALVVLSAGPLLRDPTGLAAAPPPPGSLGNLPGQGCSILRRDSLSDDQVALT